MAKQAKAEAESQANDEAQQQSQEEQKAYELRTAATKEVPGMLRVLLDIANDRGGAAGPRVAAARAVCELGGLLGPAKEAPEPLADKDLGDMTTSELEEFIRQGRQKLLES